MGVIVSVVQYGHKLYGSYKHSVMTHVNEQYDQLSTTLFGYKHNYAQLWSKKRKSYQTSGTFPYPLFLQI